MWGAGPAPLAQLLLWNLVASFGGCMDSLVAFLAFGGFPLWIEQEVGEVVSFSSIFKS